MLSVEILLLTKRINHQHNCIGEADEEEIVYRNGAKQTDLLVTVTLRLYGLQVLEREASFSGKSKFTT
jgi:hypothetical protein